MTFYIMSSEQTGADAMPNTECAIRIEHRYQEVGDDGRPQTKSIFLHNTEEAKAARVDDEGHPLRPDDVIVRSLKMCFSSLKSAQDIIKVIHRV